MENLTKQQIKEIAEQLDLGFRCFCHRETNEFIFIPDTIRYPQMDSEQWDEKNEKVDNDFFSYFEVEQLQSSDSFQIMADFVKQLSGNIRLQSQLIAALNNKNPFRNFNFIIHHSGIYRQHWFDFKSASLMAWVEKKLTEERGFQSRKNSDQ